MNRISFVGSGVVGEHHFSKLLLASSLLTELAMSDEPTHATIAFPSELGVVVKGLKQARHDWRESQGRR